LPVQQTLMVTAEQISALRGLYLGAEQQTNSGKIEVPWVDTPTFVEILAKTSLSHEEVCEVFPHVHSILDKLEGRLRFFWNVTCVCKWFYQTALDETLRDALGDEKWGDVVGSGNENVAVANDGVTEPENESKLVEVLEKSVEMCVEAVRSAVVKAETEKYAKEAEALQEQSAAAAAVNEELEAKLRSVKNKVEEMRLRIEKAQGDDFSEERD